MNVSSRLFGFPPHAKNQDPGTEAKFQARGSCLSFSFFVSRHQFESMVDRTTRELLAAGGKILWAD